MDLEKLKSRLLSDVPDADVRSDQTDNVLRVYCGHWFGAVAHLPCLGPKYVAAVTDTKKEGDLPCHLAQADVKESFDTPEEAVARPGVLLKERL
jgi:hypothetical protein